MGTLQLRNTNPIRTALSPLHTHSGRLLSNAMIALGVLFLLSATTYAAYALLKTWLMGQDRYLVARDIAPLPVPVMTWTASPTPTATDTPSATPSLTASPTATTTPLPTTTPTVTLPTTDMALPSPTPAITPSPAPTITPSPMPTITPSRMPTITPSPAPKPPSPPVKIRIPALDVSRSIIELPRTRDRRTGAWTWNTDRLFRSGRKDLVGHSESSAYPGQEGNTILVGHNYGYGYSGVFVRLGRLRPGQKVYVVNKAGQTFTYRVKTVKRVKWRRKNFGELTQHLSFLATGGSERLTLVSCSGADFEPFPERIYVVAEPAE
jgi:LPXTG-site transpeptidase (sortase) family protein